jgi:hypothetical protein
MSRTESLSDTDTSTVAAAEADLDRLLAIEPSAEFAAKVRERIATRAPHRDWRWGRVVVPLAAAVVLIVAVTLRSGLGVHESGGPSAIPAHDDVVLSRPPHAARPPVVATLPATIAVHRAARAVVPRAVQEPQVIIDPSFAAAIRRLMTSPPPSLDPALTTVQTVAGEPAALSIGDALDVPELVLKPADQSGGQN